MLQFELQTPDGNRHVVDFVSLYYHAVIQLPVCFVDRKEQ